jgi:endogenous inhibitor of DNA gyrase (YacG/DUF329 family)
MIKCPRCGIEVEFKGNPYRPFCSDRCKQIDLGNWISENYRLPTRNEDEREDEDAPGQFPPPKEES